MEPDSTSVMFSSSSSIPTKSMASRQQQPPLIKTYPYLARPQDVRRWRPWIQLAWFVHVLVTVSVLYYGIHSNQNVRKYIPVLSQNTSIFFDYPCRTVFVNALAESETDEGAIVCCPSTPQSHPSRRQSQLIDGLCRRKSKYFVFANRLARFPDAWLLPLFPLLLRGLWWIFLTMFHPGDFGNTNSSSRGAASSNNNSLSTAVSGLHRTTLLRRFYFYILLLNVRGWILYLVFNEWEDYILGLAASSMPSSPQSASCWYMPWFTPTHNQPTPHLSSTSCYGRAFDFSDHIVLYCAQILPIALTEVLYSWMVPLRGRFHGATSNPLSPDLAPRRRVEWWLPMISLAGLLYLYLITCWGMYKTAAFFHTRNEIVVGYAVTLLVQIPLWGILQFSGPKWAAVRLYLFALP